MENTLLRRIPYIQHTLLSNPVISQKVSQSDQEAQQQQNMKSERKEKQQDKKHCKAWSRFLEDPLFLITEFDLTDLKFPQPERVKNK